MRHTLTLLAALLATLAVAPAADAKWMTGNQNPPIYTNDDACRNGMVWSYATVDPPFWVPQTIPLRSHTVRRPNQTVVAGPQALPIPWQPIFVPGVLSSTALFHYSSRMKIDFSPSAMPGEELRMRWLDPDGVVLNSAAKHLVRDCYLGIWHGPRQIAVMTDDPKLAVGVLKPRQWYGIDGGIVIVSDREVREGEDIVLEPPVE